MASRAWTGTDVDPWDTYQWGWAEYRALRAQMREQSGQVLPGASVAEAMAHLDTHGPAVDGVPEIRAHLQDLMDRRIAELDGVHFDFAAPVKVVQMRIAPEGSAATPYYSRPARDFSRPGQTWLPTQGRTRFPLWRLVSTWHHEGVPGHHLQFGHWLTLADRLSAYQTSVGSMTVATEGWALYAEHLMQELGYLDDPGLHLGYLESQMLRAIRLIVDTGLHLELRLPDDAPVGPGATWTAELAREFLSAHSARGARYADSEIVRYLGMPGQAITYKLGERAWLTGREAARTAQGAGFDRKAWHMAALSLGPLGLDDLATELAQAW